MLTYTVESVEFDLLMMIVMLNEAIRLWAHDSWGISHVQALQPAVCNCGKKCAGIGESELDHMRHSTRLTNKCCIHTEFLVAGSPKPDLQHFVNFLDLEAIRPQAYIYQHQRVDVLE
jgi:hypothetical protein